MSKKWYLSRTIWLAIITGLLGILTAFATEFPTEGWLLTIIAILNAAIRLDTDRGIE